MNFSVFLSLPPNDIDILLFLDKRKGLVPGYQSIRYLLDLIVFFKARGYVPVQSIRPPRPPYFQLTGIHVNTYDILYIIY